MLDQEKKHIFWFEDAAKVFEAYLAELQEVYEIEIGAHSSLIEQERNPPIDLVIIDLMIHFESYDYKTKGEVENVQFDGIHWKHTGVEFLRRVRQGRYQQWGFASDMPIIVLTAIVDHEIQHEVEQLEIHAYLGKPYPLGELEDTIISALQTSQKQS